MKTCVKCGAEKPLEDFYRRALMADGRNNICADCMAKYNKSRYETRPRYRQQIRDNNTAKLDILRRYVYDYLLMHPCVDCGEADVVVLEFDHVRGEKIRAVAAMIGRQVSIATIDAEIAKCDVRCANCHRRKTAERAGSWRHANATLAVLGG